MDQVDLVDDVKSKKSRKYEIAQKYRKKWERLKKWSRQWLIEFNNQKNIEDETTKIEDSDIIPSEKKRKWSWAWMEGKGVG